ncbi:demethylmenaquinone methyltransferase [Psychrilyobacter atlanticus]|uniref:demethylmenaquinone methyltransferase n=1 Tax=Psychrilyobacter atlanticus TaxID=271091 RepID=UPI000420CC41|nr:demethylmenaquinone methyltransferase [Psychrilyobacter atlanticus]
MAIERDKERRAHNVFQNISSCYDFMNDIITLGIHRLWKKDLIKNIPMKSERVLDVCCGTGDIAIGMGNKLKTSQIKALDFSDKMLQVARKRMMAEQLKNIEFIQGSALSLPFKDSSFDTVTISFGIRNTSDYGKVLREINRVLTPGGIFFCMEASYPEPFLLRKILKAYCKFLVPIMGKFLARSYGEYRWLDESVEAFIPKEELTGLIEEAGFTDINLKTYLFGSCTLHFGIKGGKDDH